MTFFSSKPQTNVIDFSILNYDTLFWSILTAALTLLILWTAARNATPGVPGRFQAAI